MIFIASRRRFFTIVRKCTRRWARNRHTDNAAALAFYALISLPPFLLIGVTIAGMVLGERAAHGELEKQFTALVGADLAKSIESILQTARIAPTSNPGAFVVAMITLFYAGSHVLAKLRKTLNIVNEAAVPEASRRWLSSLISRAISSGIILLFGALLAVGTLIDGFAAYVAARMDAPWLRNFNVLEGAGWLSTYLTLTLAFALVMKLLPKKRPRWGHAFTGAAFAALVAISLKSGLDVYFRHSLWSSFVGGGLNLLLFLFWLFVSIQGFLAGAEIAAALDRRREVQSLAKS